MRALFSARFDGTSTHSPTFHPSLILPPAGSPTRPRRKLLRRALTDMQLLIALVTIVPSHTVVAPDQLRVPTRNLPRPTLATTRANPLPLLQVTIASRIPLFQATSRTNPKLKPPKRSNQL